MVSLERAEQITGIVAGVAKSVAGQEREKQKDPNKEQPGMLDVWSHTYDGMANRLENAVKDPLSVVTAPIDLAKNVGAGLTDDWYSPSASQVMDSAKAQVDDMGKGLKAIGDAKGALATVGAGFAFLTSVEQLLSTFVSVIPFPAFPALRILDFDVGLPHAHMHPPNLIPPAPPVPLPSTGPVIPIPILSGASKTLINMMPAARCGDMGLGIWCGGYFPMYEVFLGSSSVWIEGARASRLAVDITKHCIFTSPKPSDPPVGPMIGFTIMGSPNVLIGGVPMPSLLNFAMGAAIKGLFKGLGKAVKILKKVGKAAGKGAKKVAKAAAKVTKKVAKAASKGAKKLGSKASKAAAKAYKAAVKAAQKTGKLVKKGFNRAKSMAKKLKKRISRNNKGCGKKGEPVDVVTGANVDDFVDYEFPGILPFIWKRHYNSLNHTHAGPMGRSFRHEYERQLKRTPSGYEYITQEGEVVEFPNIPPDEQQTANDGLLLSRLSPGNFEISEAGQPVMEFHLPGGATSAPLKALRLDESRMEFQYHKERILTGIRDGEERLINVRYDTRGQIIELILQRKDSSPQLLATYEYDNFGNLIRCGDALGNNSVYKYDASNRMIKKTDRNNYSYRYAYDAMGRCTHTRGDDGLYDVRFQYKPDQRQTVVTFSDGGIWVYNYNEEGNIIEIIDPYGGTIDFVIDEDGNVVEEIDPEGNVTTLVYDEHGGNVARIDPLGYTMPPVDIEPDPPNPLAYELPDTPLEWEFGRAIDRPTVSSLAPDNVILQQLTPEIRRLFAGSGNESSVLAEPRQTYDATGRLVEEVDEQGRVRRRQYDPNGNVVAEYDHEGAVRRMEYSSWNLKRREADPLGNTTKYEYSPRAQIIKVIDPGGGTSAFVYDLKDRIVEVIRHGRLKERYRYDEGDALIEKIDGDGETLLSFENGPGNLPMVRRLASGENHYLEYDERGRFVRAATDDNEVLFAYDNYGQLIKDERDGVGVVHSLADGQLAQIEILGRFAVSYERDPDDNNVLIVRDPTGATHRHLLNHQGLVWRSLSNGSSEVCQYDRDGRCLRKVTSNKLRPNQTHDREYSYSAEADLQRITDSDEGATSYEYDAAHRLTKEILPDGTVRRFAYDRAGNLFEQPGLYGARLDEGNRLVSANGDRFVYNNRNIIVERSGKTGTTKFTYDSRDILTGCENGRGKWTANYDPLGRRISKSWGEHKVEYYWDDFRLAAEVHEDEKVRLYIYDDETALVPFMFVEYESMDASPDSGTCYFIFANQCGVPIRVEDNVGQTIWRARIDPYGRAHVDPDSTIEMSLRFPGHYNDEETGLHYNRFRYYSPELGRYLQSDPLGIAGGLNLYAYPANPLTNVDVDGLGCGDPPVNGTKKGKGKGGVDAEQVTPGRAPKPKTKKPPNTADWELRDSGGRIKTRGSEVSGGTKPGRRLSFPEQQKVHTEGKILSKVEGKTKPGDIVTIRGREAPCGMCGPAMRKTAIEKGIKIKYTDGTGMVHNYP